ncbi:MAG: MFS transporter [Spirochaetaceae bacterium]|nr:MFS transporter [Spirochaetaceae bacterium]
MGRAGRPLRADLSAMVWDGVAFGAMVGLGETYLPAFALALGHGAVTAGLVASLPMLCGALIQLVTPAAVGLLDSHRRWVVLCATLQALSFLPLVAGALAGSMEAWPLFAAASVYWGLGMSTGPAWTAWVSSLIPARIRAVFLARRAARSQLALMLSLLGSGVALDVAAGLDRPLAGFALVFALALAARLLSATFLASQSEPRPAPIGETVLSPTAIRRHVETGGHGRLLGFLLVFQLSVWISAPYFTPYMLGPLGFDYAQFMTITVTAFVARVLALPLLGRRMQRIGTRRVLLLSGLGIVPVPALWLLSDSFAWLLFLQLLSGSAWAAFELGSLLSFFERIPRHGQASVLTVYNLANAVAIVVGSLIGGFLLDLPGAAGQGYVVVMVVSTIARLASLVLLRGVSEAPIAGPVPALRTLGVRPSSGGIQRPVLAESRAPEASPV